MSTVISTKTSGVGGLSVTGDASGILQLASADGTTALTINASQNVGIGTSSPAQKLHIASDGYNFRMSNGPNSFGYNLGRNVGDGLLYFYGDQSGNTGYVFSGVNGERMRIDSSGNVGIGATSPGSIAKLTVANTATTDNNRIGVSASTYLSTPSYTATFIGQGDTATTGTTCNLSNANLGSLLFQNTSAGLIWTNGGAPLVFGTAGIERMRIDSAGATSFTGQVLAKHVDASGYAFRATASSTGSNAIQFVSNGSTEQAYLGCPTVNALVLRSTGGAATSYDQYWTNINGMGLIVNKVTSSNGDIGDWPTPVLALKNYDSNFQVLTMQTFAGRDDNAGYQTAADVWNIRLRNDAGTTWTTSSANTRFTLSGPGILQMISSTNGVQLTNGATSWAAASDENLKDIIEPITDALSKVSTLRTVIGKYKKEAEGIRRPFLIAQDVQKVLPEAVTVSVEMDAVDPDNIYAEVERKEHLLLSYTDLIPLLVASIKELKIIIDTQNARITTLEGG